MGGGRQAHRASSVNSTGAVRKDPAASPLHRSDDITALEGLGRGGGINTATRQAGRSSIRVIETDGRKDGTAVCRTAVPGRYSCYVYSDIQGPLKNTVKRGRGIVYI